MCVEHVLPAAAFGFGVFVDVSVFGPRPFELQPLELLAVFGTILEGSTNSLAWAGAYQSTLSVCYS